MTRSLSRDLVLNVTARSDLAAVLSKEVKSAEASARIFERELNRMEAAENKLAREAEQATQRRNQAYTRAGTVMVGFGAAVTAGLGLATKAAIGWESAWAGVTKTVDGSAPQMAKLEGDIRQLARELPATHKEIAAVAEAAGALGIKRENIISFTRTMIDLGETTDLTSDQAANALARIANVMGTTQGDIDRLGATLVELGNNGASTESEITEMAQRIAGAGHQINLSEGDVLGFASALSSVGIEAEAGGSSISTAFIKIAAAVNEGGEGLEMFAGVADMSATEFARLFRVDAAGAVASFVEGLGRMQKAGGDVFGVLDDLGLSEIRIRDAMLRTAGAGDLLRESIRTGNQAWEENSALTDEARKRYETTAARMEVARNQVNDFAITVGETFLPVVGAASEKTGAWLDVMRELPEPVATALGILGSVAGAASLAGGAFFLAVPKIAEFNRGLADMGPKGQAFGKVLSNIAGVLSGPYGMALAAGVVALGLFINKKAEAAAVTRQFTRAIEQDNGAIGRSTKLQALLILEQRDAAPAAKRLGIEMGLLTDASLGQADALARVRGRLNELKKNELPWSQQAKDAELLTNIVNELSRGVDNSIEGYKRQLEIAGPASAALVEVRNAAGALVDKEDELASKMRETKTSADALESALKNLTGGHIGADEATIRYLDSIQRLNDTMKENGRTLDFNTEQGRANRQAVIDAAQAASDHLVALRNEGMGYDEVRAKGVEHRNQLIKVAAQYGLNAIETQKLIDRYYQVPPVVSTDVVANTGAALTAVDHFSRMVNAAMVNIQDTKVSVTFAPGRSSNVGWGVGGLATGGRVTGPGTETSDSILTRLSDNEHVWSADEVRGAGGHHAVAHMRALAKSRSLPALATGGPVSWSTSLTVGQTGLEQRLADYEKYLTSQWSGMLAGNWGSGVQRWAPLVLQALAMLGQPASNLGITLRRMNQESGGNPMAINLWDVNAQRGDPSRGLMQTIGSTFSAYHHPGTSWNIYDPLANVLASMRYALARYGSLASAYNRAGGYDEGGILGPPLNATGKPERVLTPQQTRAFDQLVDVLTTRRGADTAVVEKHYHVNVINANNREADVRAVLRRMEMMDG